MCRIERLTIEDYRAIVSVWERAGLPFRPDGRDSRDSIRRQLDSGIVTILGAFDDGRLVGVAIVTHDGRKGWINRLAVVPEMRHKGIATELVRESEKLLTELGFEVFGVLIEDDKTDSQRLFEKLGYVREKKIAYYTKRLRREA